MTRNYSRTFTNGHLSTKATFFADTPYIDSCLNLSTTATLFCPQGGRCGEVRLKYCQQNELERHDKAPLNLLY